jgi:endo-1,4-beta-xylanase
LRSRREFLILSAAAAAAGAAPAALGKRKHPSGNAEVPTLVEMTGPRSLRAHAEDHALLVGCAVVPEKLDGEPDYAKTVADQMNILVPENAMKWQALRPAIDKFDFRGADEIVVFALTHNQRVRGHNLCWHEALPPWFAGSVTKQNARQILVQHIQTVAGRFAGKMHSWDVVNEAVDPASGRPDGLRKSPWLDLVGDDYIELAFRTARQADPTALLTYNDYGIEFDSAAQIEKRGQVMMLVRRLRARGVPIDAVGVQSHLDAGAGLPGAGLQEFVRELRRMGLQVFITELDVNDKSLPAAVAERDAAVARIYRGYLTMMLAEPNVTALLTWGVTDRYTWLNGPKYGRADGKPERPLPFDSDYHPVPAFFAERDAIDSRPFIGQPQAPGQNPAQPAPRGDPYAPFTPNSPAPHLDRE